ncbi:hypothetical protein SBA2_30113 [Acidobacteriia bacterium SbA2]|nr:hypothetical protein SBA2_30113 [Acidobacteriia bacterium SbA2]
MRSKTSITVDGHIRKRLWRCSRGMELILMRGLRFDTKRISPLAGLGVPSRDRVHPRRKPRDGRCWLTIKPASAGDRVPALRLVFLSPLRGLLMTLMLYPMAFAMGHILPPRRGSDGRGDLRLTPMGRCPRRLFPFPSGRPL